MKTFFFRVPAAEVETVRQCLQTWRQSPTHERPELLQRPWGHGLKIPMVSLQLFNDLAAPELSLFTRKRLAQATRGLRAN